MSTDVPIHVGLQSSPLLEVGLARDARRDAVASVMPRDEAFAGVAALLGLRD